MIGDRCDRCGACRPVWHGGAHECLRLGGTFRCGFSSASRELTARDLEFFGADYSWRGAAAA